MLSSFNRQNILPLFSTDFDISCKNSSSSVGKVETFDYTTRGVKKMEIKKQFHDFLENATEEEIKVLAQVFEGFQKQKIYHYDTVAGMLGFEGGDIIDGKFVVDMPITTLSNNRFGMTHGGILATLADSAMGYMLNQQLLQEGKYAVTTDLHIRYLAPGKGKKLIAKAFIVKKGKSMNVTQCDITNEKGTLIASVTANFFVAG